MLEIRDHPLGYRLISFEMRNVVTTPRALARAAAEAAPRLAGNRPVLISGRGPIWGYAMLAHAAHATPAVATYEPRLGAYIVVASHDERYRAGEVIPDPEAG